MAAAEAFSFITAAAASQSKTAVATQKILLRSKVDPEFEVEGGPSLIKCCTILKNVAQFTHNFGPIEIEMSPTQLKKFVELHNHFPETAVITDKDKEWTNALFKDMPDEEFKDLCWKAEYLDSRRFLEAAGDFILAKMEEMDVRQIQAYLNIVDDYTEEERKAMEENPLEFFAGLAMQQNQLAAADQQGDIQQNQPDAADQQGDIQQNQPDADDQQDGDDV